MKAAVDVGVGVGLVARVDQRALQRRLQPDLDLDILKDPAGGASGGDAGSGDDELFDEAARLVVAERQASASYLQRRLRIGFSRAARLIDMMAADGLLGPAQGSKPREVLVKADYFEEIDRVADDRIQSEAKIPAIQWRISAISSGQTACGMV